MTVADIIKNAFANIGATDIEGEPSPAQYEIAIRSLNSMLGSSPWNRITLGIFGPYSNVDDAFMIDPIYHEAIEYNLSVRLAPKFAVPISAEIAALAKIGKSSIPVTVEPAKFKGDFERKSGYNINTDQP